VIIAAVITCKFSILKLAKLQVAKIQYFVQTLEVRFVLGLARLCKQFDCSAAGTLTCSDFSDNIAGTI